MKQYRVLVADDHPLAQEAICSILAGDDSFVVVGIAQDGLEAVDLAEELQPDVILMDISMPNCNGLEATRLIKKSNAAIRIVILSVSDDASDLFTAIRFGAQGYLLKNLEPDDWLTYLHSLLEEDSAVPREIAGRLLNRFRSEQRPDEPSPNVLTPRERELLQCIAAGDTNRQIAEKLIIAENTVKNHIKNILDKLALDNRVQLAAYAVRHGLQEPL